MENLELIFKALSDPIRLQILKKLYSEESVCVCKLVDMFDISQSKLSYHLKMLLSANLIDKTSQGKWNYYSVNKDSISRVLTYDVIQKLFL
ncbi:MAG: metalloregulator ArsR/SmtB family transcription factor [Clostridiales bacterium]|uniref:ArsR/SmtB family transcription factor n=2 Tax=Terrisporobacter sp. TaxID=1965305 RepID=UPI002A57E372|nr:metalloregulator ArsR/SmtB family transcription factor [Terrisporobacter sp.]MCI5629618.1 metalloregulator ArsR/SmtB family transcription factor [Clostridium sp.]MDD7754204.1 metalloregulator ArsR/SmtB family transcription factor [Clostridiales bacterium]MCI6458316.1 metalloregulator ArsR/SmtB family transcription factor [Clostridium sp.]MCI7204699.1 metalloregulator ArsR/SmtB family transcription factor [Clostridium sp.]MDY4134072.1 metalloregulator ArsR/SmtB family transcription factor [T